MRAQILDNVKSEQIKHSPLPVGTVRGAAGHGSQQISVDLDDLLDGAGADVHPARGPAVHRQQHAALVLEAEGCGSVVKVHRDILPRLVSQNSV